MRKVFIAILLITTVVLGGTLEANSETKVATRQCSDWEATGNITVNWLTGQQVMQYRRLCCSGAPTMWCDYEYENRPLND